MSLVPSEIVAFVGAENFVVYNILAASTFTFWDYCLTFQEEEVDLIWRTEWGLVDFLFCIIRYVTLCIRIVETIFYTDVLGLLRFSLTGCKAWIWFEVISGLITHTAFEILLVMRVFAFYGRSMRLLVILLFLFLCERVSAIAIAVVSIPHFAMAPTSLPSNIHGGRCAVLSINSLFVSFWVPGLIVESILFLLLIAMFIQTKRSTGMSNPRLLVVFVRDGAWAFVIIFGTYLFVLFHLSIP
ncbi:hypothetical protein JB92DRAFT_711141 [Gautieria morchelliformis]|nr:hypothetical protein JB92DRAFT_711141 [Gautieria morchelliformis]